MLSISHALTGGFIAAKFSHPVVFIPLTLASHYLEDWIPHRDVGTGLSTGKRTKRTAIILEIGELIITVFLLYWFWQRGHAEIQWRIWLAGFIALLPDFLEAPKNFLNWDPWFLKPFNDFHHSFHHSTMSLVVGLTPQIILVAMIWFLR